MKFQYGAGLVLGMLLLALSCTLEEGKLIVPETLYGEILVTSDVDSARIFLDYQDSGRLTPALLEDVPVGRHVVQVARDDYRSTPDSVAVQVQENVRAEVAFQMVAIQRAGYLTVTSEPDSATVIVDGLLRGFTPLTLRLEEGSHEIELRKGSHLPQAYTRQIGDGDSLTLATNLQLARSVLIEHFSNTGCIPCVETDRILEDFLHEKGAVIALSIGYHANFPSPSDPMYLISQAGNDARLQFYSVAAAPTIYLDGVTGLGSLNLETRLRNAFTAREQVAPGAMVEIFDFAAGATSVSGRVRIEALQNLSNVVLRIALIERAVNFASPPGINEMTYFFDVYRRFHPDAGGTTLSLNTGEKQFVSFNFAIPGNVNWQTDQLQVVVLLQNAANAPAAPREVLQAAWTLYP